MKKILLCIFFVVYLCGCSDKPSSFHDSEGHVIRVRDIQGRWVVINYWADWCRSCFTELPQLNLFYQQNRPKNFLMFGVNFDRLSGDALRQSVKKMRFVFPVIVEDPTLLWALPPPSVLPTTYIVGPEGQVSATLVGAQTVQSLNTALETARRLGS